MELGVGVVEIFHSVFCLEMVCLGIWIKSSGWAFCSYGFLEVMIIMMTI